MKLNREEIPYSGNTVDRSKSFTIKDATLVANLLSNMYSNPIQAVVREYACNALDSHNDAGISDEPITIIAPTILHPYFEVRDHGVGLDEAQVYDLWSSYGSSTKQNSNDNIGGFGIGSKSGFAYTKDFSITAIKDGVKRLFTAYWGTNGPSIEKLTEVGTNEPNGVSIKIGVKNTDIEAFKREITNVCKWFDIQPKVENHNIEPLEFLRKTPNYGLITSIDKTYYSTNQNVYIKMGPVCYKTSVTSSKFICDIVIFANIGEYELSPDRESIIETTEVKEKITDQIEKLYRNELYHLNEEIKKQPTLYRAVDYYENLQNKVLRHVRFKWKKYLSTMVDIPKAVKKGMYSGTFTIDTEFNATPTNIKAILDTEGRVSNYVPKVKQWLIQNNLINDFNGSVLILNGTPKENLRTWLKVGRPEVPYFKYSEINTPKAEAKPKKMVSVMKYNHHNRSVSEFNKLNMNDQYPHKYLKIENRNYRGYSAYEHIQKFMYLAGVDDDVYLIPKSYWNKIPDNWISLENTISKSLNDFNEIKNDLSKDFRFVDYKNELKILLEDCPENIRLNKILETIVNYKPKFDYYLINKNNLPPKTKLVLSKTHCCINVYFNKYIDTKYPLINSIDSWRRSYKEKELEHYVELIHKELDNKAKV